MNKLIAAAVITITAIAGYVFWDFVKIPLIILISLSALILGIAAGGFVLAFLSKFYIPRLLHDPDHDELVRLFVQVDENREVIIERSGNPIRTITGGQDPASVTTIKAVRSPIAGDLLYSLFTRYEQYIHQATGLYPYVPYFTKPKVIPLPRYRVRPVEGNNEYTVVNEGEKGYFTNHVRTAMTTWYFKYSGVDIEGIPFIITGSLQFRIKPGMAREALYDTDAWNVLLDQSAITVIRSTVRIQSSIDKVIGRTNDEVWKPSKRSGDIYNVLAKMVLANLKKHKSDDGKVLTDVGIEILDVLFNDFEPQLTPEEMVQLRSSTLRRQEARGLDLIGTTVANNQRKLTEVHKNGGDASDRILAADALVRASQGNKLLEALLATFVQKNTR